ncbi:hypothetical protein A7318_26455 [Pseudomonas lurida]|uniref:hypothetical protein n=1 Tax=Pseudomonas lurida TaxID=244566 RepID=UPI00083D4840|nr:hypothetical protein [Pseudomonas lurida]AOE82007.1 hypothetical protein A7318_26455 [Pseudomonas lurida]
MSKFKASTRLTEINAEQIEQLRREYNQVSISKFSLSEAFKQYALHNRSYVIIAKNGNFEEFGKYNQILANLHTNISQIKSSEPETNKRINSALRVLLKMKLDISRLRFKTIEIRTSVKPNFEPIINIPLYDDSHSERKKQYTISFSEKEFIEYKSKHSADEFAKSLVNFCSEFSVFEKEFTNPSILYANNDKLMECGNITNSYVTNKKNDESLLKTIIDFVHSYAHYHKKLIAGSSELIAFIDGDK